MYLNKCSLISLFCFLLITFQVEIFAQQTNEDILNGRVVTSTDGNPIAGAKVVISSIEGTVTKNTLEATTSTKGTFSFNSLNPTSVDGEEIIVSVTHPDYHEYTFRESVDINSELVLQLQPRNLFIRIAGTVRDTLSGEPIGLAAIQVLPEDENATIHPPVGTTTDIDGNFDFVFKFSAPFRLRLSHISYQTKTITITNPRFREMDIKLLSRAIKGEDIFVTSDILSEAELKESKTVDRITSLDVAEVASMSAFDMVSTLREADVATQSMNMQSVSTRGFNSGANPRFLQLTDGVDNVAPGLGFPIGNLLGASDLDIASIDLLVGSSSARYGSSAMNGVLLTKTKDPYITQGISFSAKVGMHNFKFGGANPWAVEGEYVHDFSVRYAKVFWEKLAIKVTGTTISGTDWPAINYRNIGPGESWYDEEDISGYNGINVYGDENSVLQQLQGEYVPVARTGYRESDLVNYDIATRKLSGAVHYKFTDDIRLSTEGRYGYINTLYTNDSRIRLENFEVYQFKSEFEVYGFYLNGYTTLQNSGNSYNVNFLADELLSSAKSDEDWFRDYRMAFQNGVPVHGIPPNDVKSARKFADSGITLLSQSSAKPKFEPGTPEFNTEFNRLRNIYSYDGGAGIRDNSQLYHINTGYDFQEFIDEDELSIGGSFRFYRLDSDGTIFPDTVGNEITNYEVGGFLDYKKTFLDDRLNMNVVLRVDKNENFNPKISSQAGLSYELGSKQFIHISLQNGYRYPNVREQFLNSSLGKARLLGGLNLIHDPYRLQENALNEQSIDKFDASVMADLNSVHKEFNRTQAELKNLDKLEEGILSNKGLSNIKPEEIRGLEVGFRQLFTHEFYLDLNYFVNFYQNFIGIKRFVKTRTSPSEDLFLASGQMHSSLESERFYVYSNAQSLVTAQGISFDLKYNSGNFLASLNGTWSNLLKSSNEAIIPGYNTPPLKINFEWGNREIIENVGFKMIFRGRSAHSWQSPFLDGEIDAYGHFDFQFTIRIPSINASVKSGITNLGVSSYYDTYGGPAVGSIMFTTFTFNP